MNPEENTPEPVTVKLLSGFEEGTVLPNGEVVRGTYDANGVLVGWYKEPAASTGGEV